MNAGVTGGVKGVRLIVALVTLSGLLVGLGIWLDQEFLASRGPLRGIGPDVIVAFSLFLVGLVVVLWGLAWRWPDRTLGGDRS